MGMAPMVLLKKRSSMATADTVLRLGRERSSFPNRKGCVGYAVWMYLDRVSWAWS